eukprot:g2503.t1
MGSSESRLDESSSPTPPDQEGVFAVKIGDGLVDNMTGQAAGKSQAVAAESADEQTQQQGASSSGLDGLRRMPAVPDADMLQSAYDEGARDMKESMDRLVEQRVQEQLSLRSRMQAARAREEKARQEQMLIEKTLQNALIDEEADQRKLNEYTESLFNRQYQTPTNPLKCNEERADCLSCYEKTSAGGNAPLECAKFIDAFVQCANDVQREFVSRGRPNP